MSQNNVNRDAFDQIDSVMRVHLGGFCLSSCDGPNESLIEFWVIKGNVIVIQIWKDAGWDYYMPGKAHKLDDIPDSIKLYFK